MPIPPSLLRYRVGESLALDEFNRIGKRCADDILRQLGESDLDLSRGRRLLDFGCGCGRTIRWLTEKQPNLEIVGVDVDAEAIQWCQSNIVGARFDCTDKQPPLPYDDAYFDVIYCISVFTHLDESMQDLWLHEMRRLLKPQGILILTVHGKAAARFLNENGLCELEANGFTHVRSGKLRGILPEWYNTTWHTKEYIVARLSALFTTVRYEVVPDGMQDFVVAKR